MDGSTTKYHCGFDRIDLDLRVLRNASKVWLQVETIESRKQFFTGVIQFPGVGRAENNIEQRIEKNVHCISISTSIESCRDDEEGDSCRKCTGTLFVVAPLMA